MCALTWFERAFRPELVEYLLCVDNGTPVPPFAWPQAWFKDIWRAAYLVNVDRRCARDAWDTAVRVSSGDFIICVADDLTPPKHWDIEIMNRIPDFSKEAALWPDLSGDHELCTFPFITRPYLERLTRDHGYQGGAWYPEYYGMRADDDFTACATMDGVFVKAPELKFEHKHPTYQTAEWDETYYWQHRPEAFQVGDAILERRRREGFKT